MRQQLEPSERIDGEGEPVETKIDLDKEAAN
jgi:hypothetical protein